MLMPARFERAKYEGSDRYGVAIIVGVLIVTVPANGMLLGATSAWVVGRVIGSPTGAATDC